MSLNLCPLWVIFRGTYSLWENLYEKPEVQSLAVVLCCDLVISAKWTMPIDIKQHSPTTPSRKLMDKQKSPRVVNPCQRKVNDPGKND